MIPFGELLNYRQSNEKASDILAEEGCMTTPFYKISIDQATGRIVQIYDRKRKREMLDEEKGWAFFEVVRETVDGRFQKEERRAIFDRDVDLCNQNISMWNHG